MTPSIRPYVTTTVALVGAGVLLVSPSASRPPTAPVAPQTDAATVTPRAVEPAAFVTPQGGGGVVAPLAVLGLVPAGGSSTTTPATTPSVLGSPVLTQFFGVFAPSTKAKTASAPTGGGGAT